MVDYALNLAIFSMAEFYNVEAGFYRTFWATERNLYLGTYLDLRLLVKFQIQLIKCILYC
jgi:hypothetical protein